MSRGASAKRERAHEEPKNELEREGGYAGRDDERGAHNVDAPRRRLGTTADAGRDATRPARIRGVSERPLPIAGYEHLNAAEVARRIGRLTPAEIRRVSEHERVHKNRASLLRTLDRALARH
jgi:hypothetical protein